MSLLQRIETCNRHDLSRFRPLRVTGLGLGLLREDFVAHLAAWPRVFRIGADAVDLAPELDSFDARTRAVDQVIEALIEQGVISHRHGERYGIAPGFNAAPLLVVDRAAAAQFGIRTYAQHLNGYVRAGRHLQLWLGRRVRTKRNFPSMLDNTVAGGLPYGISPADNLAKECWEEAGIALALAQTAVPVGAVSYCMETRLGLRRDTLFTYDLELPADFEPRCVDGEMEAYYLRPAEAVAELLRDTEAVKPNSALVLIDFLIRHGIVRPDHPDYLELAKGLHR